MNLICMVVFQEYTVIPAVLETLRSEQNDWILLSLYRPAGQPHIPKKTPDQKMNHSFES